MEKRILSTKYPKNTAYFRLFEGWVDTVPRDREKILTESSTIIKNPVSFRRSDGGIFTRISPQRNHEINDISRRGIIRSFRAFWERKSGINAPRLIPRFPIWYVVLAICTGITKSISELTDKAEAIPGIINPMNDDKNATRKMYISIMRIKEMELP